MAKAIAHTKSDLGPIGKAVAKELEAPPQGPLRLEELFKFIEFRGAKRVQLIRTTGTGRLDATINPLNTGNILIVIEIDPTQGVIV